MVDQDKFIEQVDVYNYWVCSSQSCPFKKKQNTNDTDTTDLHREQY